MLALLLMEANCDSLWLHSRLPTAYARVALHFVIGPAASWDLWQVPEGDTAKTRYPLQKQLQRRGAEGVEAQLPF